MPDRRRAAGADFGTQKLSMIRPLRAPQGSTRADSSYVQSTLLKVLRGKKTAKVNIYSSRCVKVRAAGADFRTQKLYYDSSASCSTREHSG